MGERIRFHPPARRLRAARATLVTASSPPAAGGLVLSEALAGAMAEMFQALADSKRAKIVHALIHQDMTTSGLAELLGMSQPSVSQHLRLLRMLRIVRPRRDGRLVIYSLDDTHIRLLVTLSLSHLQETERANSGADPFEASGAWASFSSATPQA